MKQNAQLIPLCKAELSVFEGGAKKAHITDWKTLAEVFAQVLIEEHPTWAGAINQAINDVTYTRTTHKTRSNTNAK